MKREIKIYWGVVLFFAVLTGIAIFLPQGEFAGEAELPLPIWLMALINFGIAFFAYGVLGFVGLKLAAKIGFAGIWDSQISNKDRLIKPMLLGFAMGVFLIIADIIFARFNGIGNFSHPPFWTAIVASVTAGVGEEILFRLFFIPFWLWLVFYVILKKKFIKQGFWIVTFFSAIVFALAHLPALIVILGFDSISDISYILLAEIILLNGLVSFLAAYYFRKYGILAAMSLHFWTDIIWHGIWGMF